MLAALMDRMGLERIGGFAPGRTPPRTRQTDWFDAPPEAAPADRFGPATRMQLSSEALARLRRPADDASAAGDPANDAGLDWLDRPAHPTAGQLSQIHTIVARHMDAPPAEATGAVLFELRAAGLDAAAFGLA
ncbi:MAG: hypothetical protein H6843_06955 [Rhodospirillaceae bacterium]|nr:hypothetical protein [Rhodospirillaceae bacterium]